MSLASLIKESDSMMICSLCTLHVSCSVIPHLDWLWWVISHHTRLSISYRRSWCWRM
jgi:hypothetical protein